VDDLVDALTTSLGVRPTRVVRLSGGDNAASYRFDFDDGRVVFAKTHPAPPDGFFSREAGDLAWLGAANALPVPAVLAVADDPVALLALEWIEPGSRSRPDDAVFGRGLAALHRAGNGSFGRQDCRTTGSLGLPNEPAETWAEFYAQCRLLPLARIALDRQALPRNTVARLERVAERLADVGGPPEPPARLHGDLWAGNRMTDASGVSWLVDPAAHGGHREFDLAMMRLFGGFDSSAFDAYDDAFPLASGWQQRVSLHQLAPLVVHAIKFGGDYVASVAAALDSID
jgi:fructosamine-3-kinase